MFENKYLNTSEELEKFELLKKRFYAAKNATEKAVAHLEMSLNSGDDIFNSNSNRKESELRCQIKSDMNKQLVELKRKQSIIKQIEPLLVPEYKKLNEFCFYFNEGKLRTEEEVSQYKQYKAKEEWMVCDDFNKQCFVIMGVSALTGLFLLFLPFLIMGRGAIMFYLIPVWPLCSLLVVYGLYKLLTKILSFEEQKRSDENQIKKVCSTGTVLSFMRKFY